MEDKKLYKKGTEEKKYYKQCESKWLTINKRRRR
jgi:hypothetical protein